MAKPPLSMSHDELRALVEAHVLGALPADEREAFEAHVATCASCATEVRAYAPVVGALARVVPQVDPPAALRARVLSAVVTDTRPGSDVVSAFRRTDATGSDASKVRLKPDTTYRSVRPWLAAAASIALAVGLAVYSSQLRGRIASLEGRLRDALARADATERREADARRAADEAQSQVAILTAPDVVRIDLAGQPAAPTAAARAMWSRQRGLVFTASNLPPLPAGRIYQLWVLTAEPAPISAALLRPDPSGRASAMVVTPVDMPAPTAMAVTIEPEGGVPAPTGDRYLVGVAPGH